MWSDMSTTQESTVSTLTTSQSFPCTPETSCDSDKINLREARGVPILPPIVEEPEEEEVGDELPLLPPNLKRILLPNKRERDPPARPKKKRQRTEVVSANDDENEEEFLSKPILYMDPDKVWSVVEVIEDYDPESKEKKISNMMSAFADSLRSIDQQIEKNQDKPEVVSFLRAIRDKKKQQFGVILSICGRKLSLQCTDG